MGPLRSALRSLRYARMQSRFRDTFRIRGAALYGVRLSYSLGYCVVYDFNIKIVVYYVVGLFADHDDLL